jgi:hypothetical protein
MKSGKHVCAYCDRERDRCRVVTIYINGGPEYCCPKCWREQDFDRYLYKYKQVRNESNAY